MEDADDKTHARVLASSTKESGAWLRALPVSTVGNLLSDDALKIAVALRLGAPICDPHRCVCGTHVDSTGQHGLSCIKSRGRYSRHAALNEAVKRALGSAQIPSKLEPSGLNFEKRTRPDGVTQFSWKNGKCMAWDSTCVDTLAKSYIRKTCVKAGGAAEDAESDKVKKYAHLDNQYDFYAIGFETLGSWGPSALDILSQIGNRIKAHTGDMRTMEFLRQRIGIEIQRGNAVSVLGTVENSNNLDSPFFLLGLQNC